MTAEVLVRPARSGRPVEATIRAAFGSEAEKAAALWADLSSGFTAPSDRTPGSAFQVVRLAGYEDWMTGRVVYHDVWWRHAAVGLRDPVLAAVEQRLEEQG